MKRRSVVLALAMIAAVPRRAPAQQRPALREDPEDYWADVHRWTGSEATRPRGRRAAPSGTPAPEADGRRMVRTSATARVNIRRDPSLEAPVLRRMPPGSRLVVFGEGPGGWFQVGEDAPFGWVHESALQR